MRERQGEREREREREIERERNAQIFRSEYMNVILFIE